MTGRKRVAIWQMVTCSVFVLMGIVIIIFAINSIINFIKTEKNIIEYTKNSVVVEGEVRAVNTQWVSNPGKYDSDYCLYSGKIAYTNMQGEEVVYELNAYKKKLEVGQKMKLIGKGKELSDMDIAYYNIYTLRYAPLRYYISSAYIILVILQIGIGISIMFLGKLVLEAEDENAGLKKRRSRLKTHKKKKMEEMNRTKKLFGFLTIIMFILSPLIFLTEMGGFNLFTSYWTTAVVRDAKFDHLSEDGFGEVYETYKYELNFTTKSGADLEGYFISKEGKCKKGDRLLILCHDTMESGERIHTREEVTDWIKMVGFLPCISLILYLFYKVRYFWLFER